MSRKFNALTRLCFAVLLGGVILVLLPHFPAFAGDESIAPTEDAASLDNHATIQRLLKEGQQHLDATPPDYHAAMKAFQEVADLRNGEGFYRIGTLYYEGTPVHEKDEELGLQYYRRAAELGQPDAQMILGVQYIMEGIKHRPDSPEQVTLYTKAVAWLKQAAEQEHPEAMYWYGDMLVKGLGTKENQTKGVEYIRRAAEKNNANGQAMYAALLWQGQAGLPRNIAAAYMWMHRAKLNGNEHADRLLNRIAKEMSRAEFKEAMALAEREAAKNPTTKKQGQ